MKKSMNRDHSFAAKPEPCLTQSRAERYHGGTLIAEDVHDLATHERRLADPDGYRPDRCPRCGHGVLHVHDYPSRKLLDGTGATLTCIVRYICADTNCGATWRILPALITRQLWRTWSTVERSVREQQAPSGLDPVPIPRRTVQRWYSRVRSAAKQLVVLLATSGGTLLEEIAKIAGLRATRSTLVDAHACIANAREGRRFEDVAALIHRLEPGLRLV
jgi:hypothetical protein